VSRSKVTSESWPLRARRFAFLLLSIGLAVLLSACTRSIVVTRPASSCLTLIPQTVKAPTPGAPLPKDDTAGQWVAFGHSQTGQLEQANRDKAIAIEIVEGCEARDAETVKALTKRRGWFR
jgi:hypothetical protein